ncbi:MAG: hypothetical protein L3J06_04675 [Cyclobacteriaceae bacterium]|nr:hypothetical protein [Cyclobacteriaceae bacterium]
MFRLIMAPLFGWLFLVIKHRSQSSAKRERDTKYGGDYGVVGIVVMLNIVAGIGTLTMIILVLFFLYKLVFGTPYNSILN